MYAAGIAELYSPDYCIVNADLRDMSSVATKLAAAGVVYSCPTFFLSECVLVYLEPEESGGVIAWAAANFKDAAFLTYEQIHPHDAFGGVMMEHLRVRVADSHQGICTCYRRVPKFWNH